MQAAQTHAHAVHQAHVRALSAATQQACQPPYSANNTARHHRRLKSSRVVTQTCTLNNTRRRQPTIHTCSNSKAALPRQCACTRSPCDITRRARACNITGQPQWGCHTHSIHIIKHDTHSTQVQLCTAQAAPLQRHRSPNLHMHNMAACYTCPCHALSPMLTHMYHVHSACRRVLHLYTK
jgi:hypothetical protein